MGSVRRVGIRELDVKDDDGQLKDGVEAAVFICFGSQTKTHGATNEERHKTHGEAQHLPSKPLCIASGVQGKRPRGLLITQAYNLHQSTPVLS